MKQGNHTSDQDTHQAAPLGLAANLILVYFGALALMCLAGVWRGGKIILNPEGLGLHDGAIIMLGFLHGAFLIWLFLRLRAVQPDLPKMKPYHIVINLGLMVFLVWALGQGLRGPALAWTLRYWSEEQTRELTLIGLSPDGPCRAVRLGGKAACAVRESQGRYHLHLGEWDQTIRTSETHGFAVYPEKHMRTNSREPVTIQVQTRENWAVLTVLSWTPKTP